MFVLMSFNVFVLKLIDSFALVADVPIRVATAPQDVAAHACALTLRNATAQHDVTSKL